MMRHILFALLLTGLAGSAFAEAPDRSDRPKPRPATEAPAPEATEATPGPVTNSPRPKRRPEPASLSAAPATPVTMPDGPVVPRVTSSGAVAVDPIAAFFQGLAAPKPQAAPVPDLSDLAVARSPRPERRPNGFAKRAAAVTPPRAVSRAGSVCGVAEIKGEAIRAISGAGPCGIAQPVRITSVSGVAVTGGPTIDCPTARALNDWVRRGVMPAVGRTGGGLAKIHVIASYSCRTRNNRPGAKLSEHSFGHALDISGVTLKDGTKLTVLDHWRSSTYGKMIKAMHSAACGLRA